MQNRYITLNNGVKWPLLGFGTWKISDEEVTNAVVQALDKGYSLIDTAKLYDNEIGVGKALKQTTKAREEYQITTKLWNSDQGYDEALKAFDDSQKKLDVEYIDAYLIHWPIPKYDRYLDSWRALERLYREKRVRVIGVSNFEISHLERLLTFADIPPMINQIECHLALQQQELLDFCQKHEIVLQGWRPLANGVFNEQPLVLELAKHHQKTPMQIMLRYLVQRNIGVLVKSVHHTRMIENSAIFDFELSQEECRRLKQLDGSIKRLGADPNTYNDLIYTK